MKAWLKGGLIGAGIGIFLQGLWQILTRIEIFTSDNIFTYMAFFGNIPSFIISEMIGGNFYLGLFVSFILVTLLYFLIGALIGLIIQKIKSKKN